jgi:hypothetical protein
VVRQLSTAQQGRQLLWNGSTAHATAHFNSGSLCAACTKPDDGCNSRHSAALLAAGLHCSQDGNSLHAHPSPLLDCCCSFLQAHMAEDQNCLLTSAAGGAAGGISPQYEQQLRTSITNELLKVRWVLC